MTRKGFSVFTTHKLHFNFSPQMCFFQLPSGSLLQLLAAAVHSNTAVLSTQIAQLLQLSRLADIFRIDIHTRQRRPYSLPPSAPDPTPSSLATLRSQAAFYRRGNSMHVAIVVFVTLLNLELICSLPTSRSKSFARREARVTSATRHFVEEMPSVVTSVKKGLIGSSLENAVTLVLNADYKPISYVNFSYIPFIPLS